MKISAFYFLVFEILITSCTATDRDENAQQVKAVMSTDRQFSDLSKKMGMREAFLQYMDSNAVLLRAGHFPIIGENVVAYLRSTNDSSFTLTWDPLSCEVSKSADMGYTYGLYTLTLKDTILEGTYVSIWKRQPDGSWKYVLDTGNQGVGKK